MDDHTHSPGHTHDHAHGGHDHSQHGIGGHNHALGNFGRAFAIGIGLNLAYVAAEAFCGVVANSLALLADAGHNFGDVLGLAGAWIASVLSQRQPGGRYTYGLRGSSILAALGNAVALLVVTGGIAWEAIRRLSEPKPTGGVVIMVVAAVGVAINASTALLFMSGRKGDLNIKGAFLHMASDAVVTLGVVVAGGLILLTGWQWLDPAISLVVSLVIVIGTWSLLRESVNLALDAVPQNIDRAAVERYLGALPGVTEIHDLHIWGMSTTETALTVHLVRPGSGIDDALLRRVAQELKKRFGICHATFQLESGDGAEFCEFAPEHVV
jgi:cobalt-zinc-cadmium efflux system protein